MKSCVEGSLLNRLTNSLNGTISPTTGRYALSDCFMAETAIFSSRSVLKCFRSECSHWMKLIASTPNSTHFSTSHSVRSVFFVGATAM